MDYRGSRFTCEIILVWTNYRASRIPFLESALAEDKKFMAAIKEIGEEFNQTYDKLIDLGKRNL
jgi:hypothetical protein